MQSKILFKFLFLAVVLSFATILPANAQESEELTCENPKVAYLVNKTGAICDEILALHASGVGLGEIMKAAVLADGLEDETVTWETMLEAHQNDTGWGQISHAYGLAERFSESGLSGAELLALKQEGEFGWGTIVHAQSLAGADLGVSFEEALSMFESGMGWGEIRAELELPPGPPPWAGQGANKGHGPPPHANAAGNRNTVVDGDGSDDGFPPGPPPHANGSNKNRDKEPGPPPWAGNGRGNGHDDDDQEDDD